MIEKGVSFLNNNSQKLAGIIHIPTGKGPFPTVAICHGWKRTKEQVIPLTLSRNLSLYNFVSLRFDYHGCGESEGQEEDFTISQAVNDVVSALDYLEKLDYVDSQKLGLAGVSIGGGIVLAAAAQDRRVKSIAAFSPRLKFKDFILKYFSEEEIKKWKKEGVISYYDNRRDKIWRYKKTFLEDCLRVDVTSMAKDINIPTLLIQGRDDHNIPVQDNKDFFNKLSNSKIYMIDHCDHSYSNIEALYQAVRQATNWFKETLI